MYAPFIDWLIAKRVGPPVGFGLEIFAKRYVVSSPIFALARICTISIRAVDAFIRVTNNIYHYFRTFVLRLVMYSLQDVHTRCHLTTCDDWSGPHAVGLGPGGTPSRGRGRRNRRRKPSCTSRRRWAQEAGSAGRSRRSRCRRCSLRTRRRAAVVVAEGVGGAETRPLARAPKGTQKKSLDAAVA